MTNATPQSASAATDPAATPAAAPAPAATPDVNAAKPAAENTLLTDKAAAAPADKTADPAAKPADAKDPAAKTDDKKDDAKPDAKPDAKKPDDKTAEYTDFVLPDTIKANTEMMTEFGTLAKKYGLTQEAAQEFATLGAKAVSKTDDTVLNAFADLTANIAKVWEGESKADKEFGGANLDANMATAKTAIDTYATPELVSILGKYDKEKNPNGTGLGNNPEIIRLFYRLGKTISPDSALVEGKSPQETAQLSPGDKLWGKK